MNASEGLHRLIAVLKFKEEWQFESTGLAAKELFVLEQLEEGEEVFRFNEFAEKFGIKPSTLTGIIDRLEKKKLVKRQRGEEDRKATYLLVTDAGKALVDQHIEEDDIFLNNLLLRLDDRERLCFIRLVDKLSSVKDLKTLCLSNNHKSCRSCR